MYSLRAGGPEEGKFLGRLLRVRGTQVSQGKTLQALRWVTGWFFTRDFEGRFTRRQLRFCWLRLHFLVPFSKTPRHRPERPPFCEAGLELADEVFCNAPMDACPIDIERPDPNQCGRWAEAAHAS